MTRTREYRQLRDAFGQFATGVTVVTAINKAGQAIGITANSFASVSLEPPLVSWCVDRESTRYQDFVDAEHFTISVLTAEQEAVSDLFAQRSWDDKVFEDVEWFAGHNGVPQIPGASARFHCNTQHRYQGGDHLIIVGAVVEFDCDPQTPLLFFQGEYKY